MLTALISQGADLCHVWRVLDSTVVADFFTSLGVFKLGSFKSG